MRRSESRHDTYFHTRDDFHHDRKDKGATTNVSRRDIHAVAVGDTGPHQPATPKVQAAPRFRPIGSKPIPISVEDTLRFNAKETHSTSRQTQDLLNWYTARNTNLQGRRFLGAAVGPHIAKALTGGDSSAGGLAVDAAMLFPGKFLRPLGAAARAVRGARAAKAVEEAKPELTAAKDQIRSGLRGARSVRGKQEAGYSAERSARFAKVDAIMHDPALNPVDRHALAKDALRGELPKINFQGLKELDDQSIPALLQHVQEHATLLPGQKIRVSDAILGALDGKVPTRSELTLLEHVFGKETTRGLHEISVHPLRGAIMDLLNVPRSLMASFDLSAPFRQGLVAGARHPRMFFKNFGPMVRAMKSPEYHAAIEASIKEDTNYPLAVEANLAITDFESPLTREERFFSNAAEKIPVAGAGVRGSSRAYVTFLNKMRMDMFNYHIRMARGAGLDVQNEKFLKDLGEFINSSTGRGGGGEVFEKSAAALNTFLFSPRLLRSRLNFLNPAWYLRLDPYARKEAFRSFVTLGAEATGFLTAISFVPGVRVGVDPRNADWGKIRIGNTRFDIGGGFQQPLRLAAQIYTGVAISSVTGKPNSLTSDAFGKQNRLDILLRFFEGKESPIASIVTDKLRGSNQIGDKSTWSSEAYTHMVPLLAQDALDLYRDPAADLPPWVAAVAGYGLGGFGFGVQTYSAKKKKSQRHGSNSDSYFGGSSGGGSDSYFGR